MEHIKTDDTVFFTANFYHPASGYSIAADTLPQYLVYKGAATTPIINGAMVARTNHVGSYVGSVTASVANGFDSSTFYDIQASGTVTVAGEAIKGISSVKQFELNDIFDANVVQVSGVNAMPGIHQVVSVSGIVDANIVQVSGEVIGLANQSINSHVTSVGYAASGDIAAAVWQATQSSYDTPGTTGHSLVVASGNLIENSTTSSQLTTIAGDVVNIDGAAMRGTDNAVLHTNFMLVSGVMVERTRLDADYFSWGADEVITDSASRTASQADITSLATTTQLMSVSGSVLDANIVSVSGQYVEPKTTYDANVVQVSGEVVSINDFKGEASSLTTGGIADAVWTEVIADHTGTVGGAAQALVTASGNLIGSTSVSAADIADAVWDETLSDHDTPGGAGHALVTASGNLISGDWSTHGDPDLSALATGTNLEAVSGVLVARTRLDADYFSWTSDPVSVSGIVDANMVQVSGNYISMSNTIDANITQVSGEYVDVGSFSPTSAEIADSVWDETLGDHVADGGAGQALVTASGNLIGSTSVSAADIRAEMDSNSTKLIAISGSVAGLAGAAMRGTDSAALASDLEAVSGVMVARTRLDADYFSWTTDPVSVSGEVVTDSASRTASQADVTSLATTAQLMSVSGSVLDVNIVQVSGVGVGLSTATINANVVQVSGEQVDIGNFRADVSNLDSDVYFANVRYIKDTANSQDEFAVQWFTNDQPVSSGDLTSPAISVYNTTTGAAILEHQLMTYASTNLGVVRHNLATVMASGEPYLVETSGTIDSSVRTWKTIVGIDSL